MPRFLFEINWGDSGPGFSWPEAYHLAWLPGFDRYLVTASQDSPDRYGYTDVAIGHFPADQDLMEGVEQVIVGNWQHWAEEGYQHRWAYLFGTGEVDAETAEAWADEVWDPESDDDE
jgi:hypothetical protein